ncbi:MAG TPA: SDR family NAD(P)-dependent oxidoreductase [Polyangiaceae bacterium]|jgi:NAD(P)-dependent dehydrogenase (short-subunit alcohol dehydrogenase family)|nr:SDR family NAD(P)-dependent oxidoreductase [Polyangiaceae bacterium]
MNARTALVTGANRGLGLEVCRELARAGMMVIATSRREAEGRDAVAVLRRERLDVVHESCDVADDGSVAALAERLAARGEALDVLVNNAGISMRGFDASVAEQTIAVNFTGALRVTDMLGPAIRDDGRIVMVSSGMGELSALSPELRKRFLADDLTRATLVGLVQEFVRDVALGRHAERGWPTSAYRVSKAGLNALARVLARELAPRRIKVNAVCPGWVRTGMGGSSAPRSLEQGAASIAWAALLGPDGPTGGFFRDGHAIAW